MESNWSRKNLKRSLVEDEDSNKQSREKRARFPKGNNKANKHEQVLEEEEDRVVTREKARAAAMKRAKIRNQNISKLFLDDDDSNDEAEESYNGNDDGNRTEDGVQFEAFNLEREREEGRFDGDGNFVEYVREKGVKDAWLDSIETQNPIYMGPAGANEKNEEVYEDDDIGLRKRRIANVLEPGETVLQGLKRLRGNRKEKMTSETKHIFDQLTEDADKLIQNGDYNVYHEKQQDFLRQAQESCDMFGDDASSDYVFDESSGYYYSSSLGYYYDSNTGLYCSAATGSWYSYDQETKKYQEVVSQA